MEKVLRGRTPSAITVLNSCSLPMAGSNTPKRPGFFFADGCGTLEPEFEEAEAQYETEGSL